MDSTPPRSAKAKRGRSRLCAARGLLGSPIHGLAHLTDQLHFIAGETDGHFRIRSFNTREKSAISVFRSKLEHDNQLLAAREHELTTQNVRFDAALNNMSQGLVMFDKDQRLVVCNQQYVQMYGLSLDAVKLALGGKPVRKVIVVPKRIVNVVG